MAMVGDECIGLDLSTRPPIATVDAEDEQRVEERRKCSYLIDDLLKTDHRDSLNLHHDSEQEHDFHNGHSDINEHSQHSIDQLRTGW